MKIVRTIKEMQGIVKECDQKNMSIGLVPTMGYLHEGHQSLIRQSVQENNCTVVSVFVNPAQFAPGEDLDTYPRDLTHDQQMVQASGGDVIFHPSAEEMYPRGYHTYIEVEGITAVLCGKSRPTHFRGVTTVVAKLFQITQADNAYFGQKDAQQLAVIMRMAEDLNMSTVIHSCPIVRESDGLAMSSRNTYLSPEERRQSIVLHQALQEAAQTFDAGESCAAALKAQISERIQTAPLAEIDYIELLTFPELEPCETITTHSIAALAVRFGHTRLIDNILLDRQGDAICR